MSGGPDGQPPTVPLEMFEPVPRSRAGARLQAVRDCAPAAYLETVEARLALARTFHFGEDSSGAALRTLVEQDVPRLLEAARRANA